MTESESRRGSALLIVLGMLSFMIVSAVGFSAFMRFSRLPSSYLRRSSASRLLGKAALARAIDRVDMAVNNNPHPNVGWKTVFAQTDGRRYYAGSDRYKTENHWRSRILMATNDWSSIGIEDTVSTLTLEGLAYIPPPLVNEARYFSRRTRTAMWQPLDFDSGRFAFTAIDVSDCLDVNRMLADMPRNSAPNGRIRLGYMFENKDHDSAPSGTDDWDDKFMGKFRTPDSNTLGFKYWNSATPLLVSLADFNLALGDKGTVAKYRSPFADFINQHKKSFYAAGSESEEERIRNMMFVTDGYFPREDDPAVTSSSTWIGDINTVDGQPFLSSVLKSSNGSNVKMLNDLIGGWLGKIMKKSDKWKFLTVAGVVALLDYLDTDHVPFALSFPTVERVPMICGIEPNMGGAKFGIVKTEAPQGDGSELDYGEVTGGDGTTTRRVRKTVTYKIDPKLAQMLQSGGVKVLTMFPFNHEDPSDSATFKIDGQLSMFLSYDAMTTRTRNSTRNTEVLHLDSATIPNSGLNKGVMTIQIGGSNGQNLNRPSKVKSQEDALVETTIAFGSTAGGLRSALQSSDFLQVVYEWNQTPVVSPGGGGGVSGITSWQPKFEAVKGDQNACTDVKSSFGLVDASGKSVASLSKADLFGGGKKAYLNTTVLLRVRDSNNKVVDMVPACLADDAIQRGITINGNFGEPVTGKAFPLMRFGVQSESFDFSIAGLDALESAPIDMTLLPKAVLVNDPRFNHAPENWFQHAGSISKGEYLRAIPLGQPGRDSDIFMATSDSGYLQSLYELAFLPRFVNVLDPGSRGANTYCGDMPNMSGVNLAAFPETIDKTVMWDFAWKTYSPYDDSDDAFDEIGLVNYGTGQKVNPYSDSINVLMSVFANTPIDWKRCSTNSVSGVPDYWDLPVDDFNEKYAFCEYNSNHKVRWDDLVAIAENFTNEVGNVARSDGDTDAWEVAFSKLGWAYQNNMFCGVDWPTAPESQLWTVDRKFLYGYWHDCFAARQQLYLVFVRAEPMMMGGGSAGGIPPQLGSRAMAVVWRDPTMAHQPGSINTLKPEYPHRTRVLFFRQFE